MSFTQKMMLNPSAKRKAFGPKKDRLLSVIVDTLQEVYFIHKSSNLLIRLPIKSAYQQIIKIIINLLHLNLKTHF